MATRAILCQVKYCSATLATWAEAFSRLIDQLEEKKRSSFLPQLSSNYLVNGHWSLIGDLANVDTDPWQDIPLVRSNAKKRSVVVLGFILYYSAWELLTYDSLELRLENVYDETGSKRDSEDGLAKTPTVTNVMVLVELWKLAQDDSIMQIQFLVRIEKPRNWTLLDWSIEILGL